MKRIIISVTNDISYDQRMQKTANTLIESGFEVTIVGRKRPNSISIQNEQFKHHRFSMFFDKGKGFYIEYQIRLFIYLLFHSADIFCSVDLDTILPNIIIGKIKNIPVVYDAHEYFTEVPELVGRKTEQSFWKLIEQICIPQCKTMYTVCPSIAQLFSNEYNKPCDVIYNFPNNIRLESSPDNFDKKVILYQGNLNYGRGLEQMILAMKSIEGILWICGNGDLYKNLRYLIDMNELSEKVILWGYKTPSELQKMTSQATIGINLLENRGLNYYYSLANKYFDYIQHRIPSICMNFPEYKRLNDEIECSVLVDNIEVDTISNGINRLFSDKDYYQKLQNNCDIASQKYTWDSQKERLISHYL